VKHHILLCIEFSCFVVILFLGPIPKPMIKSEEFLFYNAN